MSNDIKQNKYKNSKIYTIRCKIDNNLIYVGSTIQPLYKRWYEHKRKYNNENINEYNKLLYIKIRELGIDLFYIELYEELNCENHEQLLKREGEVIRNIGTLNKIISGRTTKEYYQENKDNKKEYVKKYREENKDKIKEYKDENKDKIKKRTEEYRNENKDKIKKYREENKDKMKKYREENKDKIKKNREEKITCDCGGCVSKSHISRHYKSKIHQNYLSLIENIIL